MDFPLAVPLGQTQTAGFPRFDAYQVGVAGTTVEQLTQSLGVDVVQLRKYNLCLRGPLWLSSSGFFCSAPKAGLMYLE